MTKRAALYPRVSTDIQRDNYSVSTQIAAMLAHAKKAGYKIVGNQYVDATTGSDAEPGTQSIPAFVDDYSSLEISRPGLNSALRYLESDGFDILLVHSLDRMARDPYIRETLEREFEARGAVVEYVLGNNEDTAEGEVRKDLDATFAKWENAKRVERSTRGKKGKAQVGKFVHGLPPYGYRIDKDAQGGLTVNTKEADVVRLIFHAYVEDNISIRGITQLLNEKGIATYKGGDEWGKSSVFRILKNTTYVGYFYYNRRKTLSNKKIIERDQDEWIKIESTPIVDKWNFQVANDKLAENLKIRKSSPIRFYMLYGMVFCSNCDRPYVTQTSLAGRNRRKNEAQTYRHRAKEGHCKNQQVSARVIEPVVWECVKEFLLDPERLRKGYSESLEQQEETKSRQVARCETLKKKLEKLEQEKVNLNTAYLDPDIEMSKSEYIEQKKRIGTEITELKQKIEQAENELSRIPTPESVETLEAFAGKIRKRLMSKMEPKPEDKRKIFEMLNLKAFIGLDGMLEIRGWFGKDSDGLTSNTYACCDHQLRRLRKRV